MSAIEKLQMLIEAAEYLDRRERGKVTHVCLCDIGMQTQLLWRLCAINK